jgi:transposase
MELSLADHPGVEIVKVERLDHLGIIAGVIKDLGIIEMIDTRIAADDQEQISTGEAVAGMILNGLGFSKRPLSLTPQFFANKPLEVLFREDIAAEHFNRFKLGRSLDKIFGYGCDFLFSEIALSVCQQEGIDLRFSCLDTSSFSLTGEYIPETDEQAIGVTHGYSKDHRPDLKQAVLELMVSQDGGVPLISRSWDGNASDNAVFKERCERLIEQFKDSETPRYLIADSKLYTKNNASNLAGLPFITRIPETLKVAQQVIDQAWDFDQWQSLAESQQGADVSNEWYRYQRVDLCHYGIEQRWLVVYSDAAFKQAEKTLAKAEAKEQQKVQKQLFHLQAQRFDSEEAAHTALDKITPKLNYHKLVQFSLTPHVQYATKGRPTAKTPIKGIQWQIQATVEADSDKMNQQQQRKACFVLSTNISDAELTDFEIFAGYKGQSAVEQGFRFLKDPIFFVSSLFVKKPSRIQGLLMVMTLALLVYSVAQRRMRKELESRTETVENQIGQPTERPTLRWIFQLLEGINLVVLSIQRQVRILIEGLTDSRKKILRLFGQKVCQIYQISSP